MTSFQYIMREEPFLLTRVKGTTPAAKKTQDVVIHQMVVPKPMFSPTRETLMRNWWKR